MNRLRRASELMLGMVSGLDRKNCWTIAEHRGDTSPDGLQHLLSRAQWDADGVRDDLREYVIDAFGDPGAILVVDETGDVKKGVHSVGVQRQYTGTAGRIENSQVAVYLTYAAPRGHALIDRALYLPRSWVDDPDRCTDAGIPANKQYFATKPTLAAALITRAVEAKVPAAWVAGDEVYGADPRLRAAIRGHRLGYVLAISANRRVPTHAGPIRVDRLPAQLPSWAWQKHSAGAGSHGQRYYSWAWITLLAEDDTDTGGQRFAAFGQAYDVVARVEHGVVQPRFFGHDGRCASSSPSRRCTNAHGDRLAIGAVEHVERDPQGVLLALSAAPTPLRYST